MLLALEPVVGLLVVVEVLPVLVLGV